MARQRLSPLPRRFRNRQPTVFVCQGLCSAKKLFPARMRDNFVSVTGIHFLKLADQPIKSLSDSRKFIEACRQSGRLNTSDLLKDCRHFRRPYGSQKPSQVDAGVANDSPLLFAGIRQGESAPPPSILFPESVFQKPLPQF